MPIKAHFISFLQVLNPIAIGLLIYLLFRGIPFIHLKALIITPVTGALLSFCKYNLPDALWLFGLLQALRVIWQEQLFTKGLPWLLGGITGALLSEYAQKLHVIPGTFDWLDIATYLLVSGIYILICTPEFINQHKFSV